MQKMDLYSLTKRNQYDPYIDSHHQSLRGRNVQSSQYTECKMDRNTLCDQSDMVNMIYCYVVQTQGKECLLH